MKTHCGVLTRFVSASLVVVGLVSGSVAHGAPFTWDASGGTPLNDGSGAWNATGGTNWFDGTNYGSWGNTSADTATFGVASGAAGTITVGNVTVNAITFDAPGSGNYTLSSGTITMAGTSPTMTVNASGTTTISSILAGSDNWTKSGTGTLLLSNGATFSISGTTTVNAGILALNGPNSATGLLGNSAGFVINNGGTIRVDSFNALMGNTGTNTKPVTVNSGGLLTLSDGQTAHIGGVVTLAGGTLGGGSAVQWGGWWLDNATTSVTENSVISNANVVLGNATANSFDVAAGKTLTVTGNFGFGSSGLGSTGRLTKIGTGTMTLAGGNAYTGTTSVNAGTLQIGNNGTAGSIAAASAVTGSAGAVLAFNRTDNYGGNFSNTISGGLALTINSGTIALTGTNTYTGVTALNAGIVNLGSAETAGTSGPLGASAAANPGNIVLAGGTLQYSASNANDYSGRFSTASNQRYNIDTNSRSVTFATLLSSTGGSLTKLGSGTLALSAANTYTGTTTPSAGTLQLDNNLALQNSVLNTSGGGSLALGSGITAPTIGGLAGSTNLATAFGNWSQATALTLNPLSGTATYTGVIAEGAVGTTLTKNGAGTQVLQSASSYTYTGTTTVNGGVLVLNGPNSPTGLLGNSAGFVINNGGTIRLESWNALMGYTNSKPVTINSGGLLTMPDGNTAWIRGPLTLAGGTLAGGFNGAYGGWNLGSGTTTVTENSAITGTSVVLADAAANVFDVAAGKTLTVTGYFGWGSDASSKKNGNLTKAGAGTMSLTAANFYSGTTTVNGGVLAVGGNNSTAYGVLGYSAGFVINNGGTLRVDTENALMGNSAANAKPVTVNTGGLLTINGVAAHIAGVLTLAGGTLAGTPGGQWGGWWLDNATTSVTENSTISAGNVVLANGTANGFDVAAGKTLLVTGNFGYGSSTVGLNGSLAKLGSGTMTLDGANTYTGTTAINAGTLQIGNGGTAGSIAASTTVSIASGATLAFNRIDAYGGNFANAISGSGGVALVSGSLTFSTAKTYTGQTRVSGGMLSLGIANAISNQSSLLVDGGGFNLAGFDDTAGGVTITSGSIYGNGTLTATTYGLGGGRVAANLGAGTLTVTANSSLDGSSAATVVNLNAGALSLGSGGRFMASSVAVSGSSGASLTLGGNEAFGSLAGAANIALGGNTLSIGAANAATTYSGVLSGVGGLTKVGSGVFTLANANTYSGNTVITGSGSVLKLGAAGSFANSPLIVVGDAASTGAILDLTAKSGTFPFGVGQTLKGGGTIQLAANGVLDVQGTFAPGNSPGLFTYDGGTTLLSGTTLMEILGTNRATLASHGTDPYYDAVNVINSGTLNFGGLLSLDITGTYANNNVFNLFSPSGTGSSLTGNFSSIVFAPSSIYSSLTFTSGTANPKIWTSTATTAGQSFTFDAAAGTLVVVPEPGTILFAGIGIAMAGWSLRKRRRTASAP